MLPTTFKKPEKTKDDYTQLQDGENRLRVLTDFISGQKYWVGEGETRKPVRVHDGDQIPVKDLGTDKWGNPERVRAFIAAVVWNYTTKRIEVFETDKISILSDIFDLETDVDWGDVSKYDIKIRKSGEGKETRYKVDPAPAKPLDITIKEAFKAKVIDLNKLFEGGEPMDTGDEWKNSHDEEQGKPEDEGDIGF